MSVKQSRNIDSESEGSEIEEVEEFYSEDVKARVAHFNQHASEITQVIDDLISAGCEVMENLKQRFVNRMEGVKEELLSGVQSENQGWGESSKKSKEDLERLISIKELDNLEGITVNGDAIESFVADPGDIRTMRELFLAINNSAKEMLNLSA